MHLHVLGACGTFMAGVSVLARSLGHHVTGVDHRPYPPMSTLLADQGIEVLEGYRASNLDNEPDLVVVGNVMTRGNEEVETVLARGIPYTSGPQWLAEHVLRDREVLAVAGTHGKTTTTSMLAWILAECGRDPGFLIGGVPIGLGVSARLGSGPFVIEADEYDTAFFDKRSKFVHYRPRAAALLNLEFDHGDIFGDLGDIERQFHHLVRTVPGNGRLLVGAGDEALDRVLGLGCWTPVERFSLVDRHAKIPEWRVRTLDVAGTELLLEGPRGGAALRWSLFGAHNASNALAAVALAEYAGVPVPDATVALERFQSVRRRLERLGVAAGVTVFDDFAHHPTEVLASLTALRGNWPSGRVLAVFEPRSNSMRDGLHRTALTGAFHAADEAWMLCPPDLAWSPGPIETHAGRLREVASVDALVEEVAGAAADGDAVVSMSNGSFDDFPRRVLARLRAGEHSA